MNGLDLLVFGLVGPLGCDKTLIYNFFKHKAEAYQYDYNKEIIQYEFFFRLESISNKSKFYLNSWITYIFHMPNNRSNKD
ncbi:hypothetical protein BpHYR1_009915 [Brachionus plicatilis]|uniref:Uncharacterized protein n=1 Tax=Brachionus plicatilis TaxID=10195 RepID=A0A3M7QMN9_BRAPC|nr:hypothetical protein BpHYR1_009915 [Brachionus plicatilis]